MAAAAQITVIARSESDGDLQKIAFHPVIS